MSAEYVVYGRLSILKSEVQDITFEELKDKFPTVKESLLLGAWKIVNPKGKLKKGKDA